MAKYEKSQSNYILRRHESLTKYGNVYENDLKSTSQKYNNINGNIIYNTEGGFTYTINDDNITPKKYNNDGWASNTYTLSDFDRNNIITSVDGISVKNINKYVKLNNTYIDLEKYCYYGSANEMLNSTINNIIINFPAGIHISTCTSGYTLTTDDYENPLSLDLQQYESLSINYNIKTIHSSYYDYELVKITPSGETFISNITGYTGTNTGTTSLTFLLANENIYNSDLIIRPNANIRNYFFDNLQGFSNILLDKNTIPKYTSKFKSPTENGDFEIKTLTWETSDGYNIDIDSPNYAIFLTWLVDATNYIDELYNDNLYRMMVHDSIKDLDNIPFFSNSEYSDDILIGDKKINSLIRIYGRNFDDLKNYIDGIAKINAITYNNEENTPKEYINSRLEQQGWDCKIPEQLTNISAITNEYIFNNTKKSFNGIEVIEDVFKKIIINSKPIFKSKGTRKCIRKIFQLFGVDESWYEMREYIQKVDDILSGETLKNIAQLNFNIKKNNEYFDDSIGQFEYYYSDSIFENTNIGLIIKCPQCGSYEYLRSGYGKDTSGTCENGHVFLLVDAIIGYPKHNNRSNFYFQQKGLWYNETGGEHSDFSGSTYVNETAVGNNPHIGNGEYDSGYDYISQFSDIYKNFVRNANEYINISGYSNQGFIVTHKKELNNIKVSNGSNDYLTMNLKNIIIGIDGVKILESFLSKNKNALIISNNETINGDTNKIILSGLSSNINIDCSQIPISTMCKIYNKYDNINSANIFSTFTPEGSPFILYPGKAAIVINGYVTEYYGEDEFELIKSLVLPYIEQIIPSTALFNFMKIENDKPIWGLADQYYDKNIDGSYNGYHVVAYQNINYFDEESNTYDDNLTNLIEKNHGTGYTFFNKKTFVNDNVELNDENGHPIYTNEGEKILISSNFGYDNIYMFRKKINSPNINTTPIWVLNNPQ